MAEDGRQAQHPDRVLVPPRRTRLEERTAARPGDLRHCQGPRKESRTDYYPLAHAEGLLGHSRCLESRLHPREHRDLRLCPLQPRDGAHAPAEQGEALLQHAV